jgi:hypothetical protein
MPANDEKNRFWWCSGHAGVGHVVAETMYCQQNGQKVKALWWYMESLRDVPTLKPQRGLLIIGDAPIVPCTICANTTKWSAGKSALMACEPCEISSIKWLYNAI